ncbi:MAG: lipopolysaccharide kinase InaA family protein [Methylophagaceae bacterium]
MFPVLTKWIIFPPWKNTLIEQHFPSINEVFKLKANIISSSAQSEIFSYELDGQHYFVKRYFRSMGLGSWFGFSRLRVEARNQHWFNKMNVPAARVVAYGEQSFLLKTIKGILITEGIDNVRDLMDIANHQSDKFADKAWQNAIIFQLAHITAVLHQNRFCHNDLHWRNILVQENETDRTPKVFLIDCPSGKRLFWPLLQYRQLKDLANLDKIAPSYLSRTQRLRFFKQYRQITILSAKDKTMIGDILSHKTNRIKRKVKQAARK